MVCDLEVVQGYINQIYFQYPFSRANVPFVSSIIEMQSCYTSISLPIFFELNFNIVYSDELGTGVDDTDPWVDMEDELLAGWCDDCGWISVIYTSSQFI
jgi:hypothetical protein